MTRYEYMKIPLNVFPDHIIHQYQLKEHTLNGFVYIEIRKAIYGLPQAGILANQLLRQRLRPHGYYEVPHTPGLWKHTMRPIQFTLTVDDFGVKYVGRHNADHLIAPSNKTTSSRSIGMENSTVVLPLNGITTNATSTSQCPATLTNSWHDSTTNRLHAHNIAHTSPQHTLLDKMHNYPPHTIHNQHCHSSVSAASNKLWAPSCTMHKPSTSPP